MNGVIKNILKYLAETMLMTTVWCGLEYFTDKSLNIAENLITVALIVLMCNITDYIVKKFKKNK